MAGKKSITKLDKKLISSGIIEKKYKADYAKVHKKLNSIIKKTGRILSEKVFKKGDAAMREWLMSLYKLGASQEKLTSYLRCGLAHLSFDFIDSTYKQISEDDLIARALQSFKKRKFQKTFFKVSTSNAAAKKTVKKPAKKKAIKRKPVNKKAGGKKAKKVVKKKTVKKVIKKKAAKKPTKKVIKKKPAKKKAAKIKSKLALEILKLKIPNNFY